MRILPCGDRALLVELSDGADVLPLRDALLARLPDGVEELVPGAATLLVRFGPSTDAARLHRELAETVVGPMTRAVAEPALELSVRYDGADLEAVAASAGVTSDEVVQLHTSATYTVAFCGFSPGFGYLTGLDARLHVPRVATPRTRVPPGSVAIAVQYTGVYPRSSPGGWRLLGRTDAALWDLDRAPPALLTPGQLVRFVAT